MANYFSTPGWVIHLARRLLYFWVRTTVFPQHPDELGLDPAKPVCYVLQHPHVSNLLIVYRESRSVGLPSAEAPFALGRDVFPRSACFLNPKPIPGTGAGEPYAPAPLMTAMVRETLADARLDVQIVPVVILWGRHPGKQESILKALFAEAWQQPGPLRRLLTILLHGRNVLVRFNTPLSLHAFCRDIAGEQQALQKLSRVLREHFRRQRQMAIGPDLSHRHTQVGALLDAPRVRSAIATEAETQHISPAEARLRARRFILEIASDYSYGVTRAFELALSWLWTQLFDGIEIHHAESITQIAPGLGIIYIPTHRSHMDYLLLSYIVHHQGLASPHIAAGDNLNFFLVGPLLRRAGATDRERHTTAVFAIPRKKVQVDAGNETTRYRIQHVVVAHLGMPGRNLHFVEFQTIKRLRHQQCEIHRSVGYKVLAKFFLIDRETLTAYRFLVIVNVPTLQLCVGQRRSRGVCFRRTELLDRRSSSSRS